MKMSRKERDQLASIIQQENDNVKTGEKCDSYINYPFGDFCDSVHLGTK